MRLGKKLAVGEVVEHLDLEQEQPPAQRKSTAVDSPRMPVAESDDQPVEERIAAHAEG